MLEQAQALNDGSDLVFPSPLRRGKPLSNTTLTKVLRDRGFADKATVHGFRSSFRDWCAETDIARQVAEEAYFRSDLFAKRRPLMGQCGAFLAGDPPPKK